MADLRWKLIFAFLCHFSVNGVALFTMEGSTIDYYLVTPSTNTTMMVGICSFGKTSNFTLYRVELGEVRQFHEHNELSPYSCCSSYVNLTKRREYALLMSVNHVSVTVLIILGPFKESYMALPVDQWVTEYFVVKKRVGGFILIISERSLTIRIGDFKTPWGQIRPLQLKRLEMHRLGGCDETLERKIDSAFDEIEIHANGKLTAVTGSCPDTKLHRNLAIESVLPQAPEAAVYQYLTFCLLGFSCFATVLSPYSAPFVTVDYRSLISTTYFQKTKKMYKLKQCNIKITSTKFLQVTVYFQRPNQFIYSIQSMSSVIPVSLFTSEYVFAKPKGYPCHTVVVTAPVGVNSFYINDRHISCDVVSLDILFQNWHIMSWNLSSEISYNVSQDIVHVRTAEGEPFGCYVMGSDISTSFTSPLGPLTFNNLVSNDTGTLKVTAINTSVEMVCPTAQKISPGCEGAQSTLPPSCNVTLNMTRGDTWDNDCDGLIDEEMKNDQDDDGDGFSDEDLSKETENGCLPGWFGTKCDKMCRCENLQCLPNGFCKENITCQPNYFGTQCQYKDAVVSSWVSQEEMKRRGPTKCQSSFIAVSPLSLTFDTHFRFTWLQIEGVSKESLEDLEIEFGRVNKKPCYTGPCFNRRDIFVQNTTLIVLCTVTSYVCRLKISFAEDDRKRHLCSVYVSKGRNVALRKPATMSSLNFDASGRFSRPFFAVDGSRRPDCATTELDDAESSWQLVFPSMMTIHELVIIFNVVHSSSEYYTLTFLSERGEVVYNTTSKLTNRSSLIPHTQAFVKSIEISLRNTQVPLSICEFEAYGECAPPLYGPECTEICSITCEDQVCTYDGYCNQCPKGTGGTHCFEGCLSWCGDDEDYDDDRYAPSTNSSYLPYHTQTGFRVENFWFYVMMLSLMGCIIWISDVQTPAKKPTPKQKPRPINLKTRFQNEDTPRYGAIRTRSASTPASSTTCPIDKVNKRKMLSSTPSSTSVD
ncbi:hypothetical protein BgiBS90_013609 [Biomphalaria glabrata]|nr:hypothetical protein BgiBS90_013609 [Biomphalaria glabrata]